MPYGDPVPRQTGRETTIPLSLPKAYDALMSRLLSNSPPASRRSADNGADRQRYVAAELGLEGLVRWLADETVASARDYLERRM
jgi:hypothetical protein